MTSKSSCFVFVALLVSGSLVGACGDGQIGDPRLSPDDEPAPDQLGVDASVPDQLGDDEPAPDQLGAAEPAPPALGTPYGHVVPSDVGKTIGVGVVAPVPTAPYTGPSSITTPGITIENVVMTSCPYIQADNVTLRNVIIDCDHYWSVTIIDCDGCTVEYSRVEGSTDKSFRIKNSPNTTVYRNEILGGEDFFYLEANTDNLIVEDNYMHDLLGTVGAHADGFQWTLSPSGNTMEIRGNYFDPNNPSLPKTDLLFSDNTSAHILFENNYIKTVWGYYTLRIYPAKGATMRNNVYGQVFKTALPASGSPSHALLLGSNAGPSSYECNRYEDGDFIEQQYITGNITHDTTGCPNYP